MGRRLMRGGLLIASITLLGFEGSALARDQVAYEQSLMPMTGMMHGMMGPGMMGPSPTLGGHMGKHIAFFDRPITLMLERKAELKLTPEQVAKLENLRAGFQKKAEEGFQTLRELHGELAKIVGTDKVDLAKAEATLKSIAARRSDLALKRIEVIEEGKSVLTDEQRATFTRLSATEHCSGMET
ncbi:MAG: Spy/CpxP family protein refolding chaperone [Candidatus Methylomirabilales bacterium]